MSPSDSPRLAAPPHIRLNSHDVLDDGQLADPPDRVPPTVAHRPSSRSLLGQFRPASRASPLHHHHHHQSADAAGADQLLLPPARPRTRGMRDDYATEGMPGPMRTASAMSAMSQATTWSSESGGSAPPLLSPFDDASAAPSRCDSDDDVNTQTVADKYAILPSAGLLLFPEDVERDDYLHTPDPADDAVDCNLVNLRALANVGGLACIAVGILVLFVVFPILYALLAPLGPVAGAADARSTFNNKLKRPHITPCTDNPLCIPGKQDVPLLRNVRHGLIDPATPKSAMSRTARDGTRLQLVVRRRLLRRYLLPLGRHG